MAFRGYLKLSTQVTKTVLMIDSSDHITGKTGLTITKYLTKAGGTPTAATMTTSELDSTNAKGIYSLVFTTSHTDTLGEFQLHTSGTSADPSDDWWEVVTYLPGEAAILQTGTGTGQLDFTSGVVKVDVRQLLGTAWLTPGTAGTPDVNAKLVGATAQTGRDIGASVLIGGYVAGQDHAIRRSTATAGGATTITLDAGANTTDAYYARAVIAILSGTGIGQARLILSYVGATKVATVSRAWVTNPDNTSVFAIFPGEVDVEAINDINASPVTTIKAVQGLTTADVVATATAVTAISAGGIAAASFAANAITAAKIATDAIGAAQLATDAVTEIWANACTEPTAVVAASPTAIAALSWLLTLSRNLVTQTSTTQTLKADDGSTTVAAATLSDDGTTFSRGKFA